MFLFKHAVRTVLIHWKRFLFFVCLTALLCVATGLLGNFFLQDAAVEPITLLVVDQDGSPESILVYNAIADSEQYGEFLIIGLDTHDSALERLKQGEATAVAVIPEGFAQSVMTGENMALSVWYDRASPLKTQIVNIFAGAFTDMLKTSQIGVYTALEYARAHGTADEYQAMFLESNLGYLGMVVQREALFVTKEVSATGQVGIFAYYLIHALVFLLLLSPVLFLEVLRPTFSAYVIGSLRRLGVPPRRVSAGNWAAIFLLYLAAGGLLAAAFLVLKGLYPELMPQMSLAVLPMLLVVLAAVSAFALFIAALCHSAVAGGMLLSALALVSLLLSGGIIPKAYLASGVQTAGYVTLHSWAVRLLSAGSLGQIDPAALLMVAAFGGLFFAAATMLLHRQGRRGVLQ